MNALKAIQTSFPPTKHVILPNRKPFSRKNSVICFSKSNDPGSESSPPEGDASKQELLARIAMLQTMKVRLTDYLDERSAYLTQFAEEANAEFEELGEDARKGLEEAEARIMENLEGRMQSFEESSELNREEIEKDEKMLVDFEDQIEKDLNEGLFFKNLGEKKAPAVQVKAKEETNKIRDLTRENAGSNIRKNAYLTLMALLSVGILDALITGSDWRKVAVLGAIFVALLYQFLHEQQMSSETGKTEKEEEQK